VTSPIDYKARVREKWPDAKCVASVLIPFFIVAEFDEAHNKWEWKGEGKTEPEAWQNAYENMVKSIEGREE